MVRTKTRQANFSLPGDLLEELRSQVPKGEQSKLVAEALKRELMRLRFRRAIDSAFGAWSGDKHPELKEGTEEYLRRLRHSSRTDAAES
jgi:hypothetical protein